MTRSLIAVSLSWMLAAAAAPSAGQGTRPVGGGAAAVRVSEATVHGDMDCFKVETPSATFLYGKRGAGFASILDKDGRDWVSYRPGGKARGEYRGLPKCGQPTKFFHCGYGYGQYPTDNPFTSRVTVQEAGHARIESETRDGKSACTWDFYPDHATLTLLRIRQAHVLVPLRRDARRQPRRDRRFRRPARRPQDVPRRPLVAGRPVGLFSVRAKPRSGSSWSTISGPSRAKLTPYVSWPFQKENDGSYQEMTVFGFGRKGYKELVQHVPDLKTLPARFSIGFVERADFPTARAACERLLADATGESRDPRERFSRLLGFEHGDAARGRTLFADPKRSACALVPPRRRGGGRGRP